MAYREHTQPILKDSIETLQNFEFDLDASIERIAHWLPAQGPIKDFIHHNTLHAVQHYPFHEGVAVAAKIFGARSYLPLEDYQRMYQQGRIKSAAIEWAIEHSGCPQQQHEKLRETLFEQDDTGHYPPVSLANHGIRTTWLTRLEVNLNALVHPVLFRLLGNFLDQGISRWSLPKNGEHFWDCVLRLAQNSLLPLYPLNEPEVSELLFETPDYVIKACLKKNSRRRAALRTIPVGNAVGPSRLGRDGALSERGIDIPDGTRFIAALHNTSRDEMTYFDKHLLAQHPVPALHAFQQAMKKALQRNARERCRWFELGPQSHSNEEAHEHVIERASSIFEPRPEYNHSNNLYAIVGRRALTRDLFMDRRAFLHSYDPQTDAQGDIMARILSAVIPVCGGINLG